LALPGNNTQYSKELSKGKEPYEAAFQGAKAKPGPLGLDSLLYLVIAE